MYGLPFQDVFCIYLVLRPGTVYSKIVLLSWQSVSCLSKVMFFLCQIKFDYLPMKSLRCATKFPSFSGMYSDPHAECAVWALSTKPVFGVSCKANSNQSPQLQRLAR